MLLYAERVLSDQQLKKLGEHKYSSSCQSLLDPAMQKFWNWFIKLVPLWIAPNLITMVGLGINIVTTLVLVAYCPTATEIPPWWTTALCALGLFIYQTLDAIDGKQARRTNTSTPLGELFDHGCDSMSTVFVSVASCCAVQLGTNPGWMLFQCVCASTLFYCAHWQTYVSGTLQFGTIDVTEGQIVVMGVMLLSSLTSFLGLGFWTSELLLVLSPCQLVTAFGAVCGVVSLAAPGGTIDNILNGGAGKSGSTVAGTSVLSPSFPLLLVIVPAWVIAYKSDQAIYHNQPILYVLMFGLIAAKMTNRLVVAHMCKSEIHHRDPVLLAPLALFLNQYFNTFFPEDWLLKISLAWVIFDLVRYCSLVCLEICDYLKVDLFRIPYPPPSAPAGVPNQTKSAQGPVTRQRKKVSKS